MTIGYRRYIDLRRERDFNPEEESSWISNLKESTLFLIALVVGIAISALTGKIIFVSAVLITACVFVLISLIFRPVDRAFSQIDEKSKRRRQTD